MKICTGCKTNKENHEFSKDNRAKTGLQSRCKDCHALDNKPYSAKRYERNKEEIKAAVRQYQIENPQAAKERTARWKKENPQKVASYGNKRRATEGVYTAEDVQRIYTEQNGKCAYCSIELQGKFHVDHIHPLSRGGSNWPSNLACACKACNLSKGSKLLGEWNK